MIKTFRGFLPFFLIIIFLSKSLSANPEEKLINGEKIYIEKCVLCHGKNGSGWDWGKKVVKPPVPVADLKTLLPDRSDDYLKLVIKNGGSAVGLTDFMPALGFNLSDEDLDNLIFYLRSLNDNPELKGSLFRKRYNYYANNFRLEFDFYNSFFKRLSSLVFASAMVGSPKVIPYQDKNHKHSRISLK